MKTILYTGILGIPNLSAIDKIIYCQILYHGLCSNRNYNYTLEDYDGLVANDYPVNESLARKVNVSRSQFYEAKKRLLTNGFINEDGEAYLIDGITERYFELRPESGLSGVSLIVYSYICHLCDKYGWTDRYHGAIANDLCLSLGVLKNCLSRLYKSGHLARKFRGKQTLLAPA